MILYTLLDKNEIGKDNTYFFIKALKNNTSLEKLYLGILFLFFYLKRLKFYFKKKIINIFLYIKI